MPHPCPREGLGNSKNFHFPAAEEEEEGEDDEGDEVAIYHLVGGEDDEQLEPIEDDALLDEVFAEFCSQYDDFEDADEAASLEPEDGE